MRRKKSQPDSEDWKIHLRWLWAFWNSDRLCIHNSYIYFLRYAVQDGWLEQPTNSEKRTMRHLCHDLHYKFRQCTSTARQRAVYSNHIHVPNFASSTFQKPKSLNIHSNFAFIPTELGIQSTHSLLFFYNSHTTIRTYATILVWDTLTIQSIH